MCLSFFNVDSSSACHGSVPDGLCSAAIDVVIVCSSALWSVMLCFTASWFAVLCCGLLFYASVLCCAAMQ